MDIKGRYRNLIISKQIKMKLEQKIIIIERPSKPVILINILYKRLFTIKN
jgi:hypothetical protein